MMFWCGIALAPLAALLLLVGSSGFIIKLALIVGLGSVVLIGLSVTWRKDAGSVEKSLNTAISDVEAETHQMIADLRHQVRAIERGSAGGGEREIGGGRGRPRPEMQQHQGYAVQSGQAMEHDGYPREQYRRSEAAYESTGEMDQQRRAAPMDYDRPREQRRRAEAAYESTGEMDQQQRRHPSYEESEYRRTETVSVTHRRAQEEGYGAGRNARSGRARQDDPRAEADSILSGLQATAGQEDDWRGGETVMVPQQHHSRHEDAPRGRGRNDWHAEERSAEMRMGVRQTRGGRGDAPEDGWSENSPPRRRGRHYDDGTPEPTRAISAYEANPQPRWGDYNEQSRGGSYMDQYYGENTRR